MTENRFTGNRYHLITGMGIEDDLTGNILTTKIEYTNQLNQESQRADKNAELYWKLRDMITDADDLEGLKKKMYKELVR